MIDISNFCARRVDSRCLHEITHTGQMVRVVGQLLEVRAKSEEYSQECVVETVDGEHVTVVNGTVRSCMCIAQIRKTVKVNLSRLLAHRHLSR